MTTPKTSLPVFCCQCNTQLPKPGLYGRNRCSICDRRLCAKCVVRNFWDGSTEDEPNYLCKHCDEIGEAYKPILDAAENLQNLAFSAWSKEAHKSLPKASE